MDTSIDYESNSRVEARIYEEKETPNTSEENVFEGSGNLKVAYKLKSTRYPPATGENPDSIIYIRVTYKNKKIKDAYRKINEILGDL